ncbi:MAG TPA: diguanylate cyclase [Solirubrobacteraceae bacterium]|nr:diguanylate cyclase [Solirubrobacteraceae bacterium]
MERAAEALLREHPDALVCGLSANGLIMPLPGSVPLWGQVAIEGRAVIDGVVAADRGEVVSLWKRLEDELAVNGKVRMLSQPKRWVALHLLDLTGTHGVRLCVILPGDEAAEDDGHEDGGPAPAAGGPRFATLLEDEGAKVIECDDAFTEMFGYTAAELIGKSVLDQIHPDDQGRAVEGWLNVLSTRRHQQTRMRRRRKDGSWVWVDTTLHNFLNQNDRNYVLIELIDVSAEMAAQEALREREELLRGLTEAMPVGLMQLDRERNAVYYNARLQQLLGTGPDAGEHAPRAVTAGASESISESADADTDETPPPAQSLLGALTCEGRAEFEVALTRVLEHGEGADVEVDVVPDDGEWRRMLMSIRSLLRADGDVNGAIVSVLDVTDSAVAHRELERRATFDALTGCYNRGAILELLERELERADGASIGVVYVDLDKFKPVNDTLGHAAGDELLASVAERLRELTRREDNVGRLGGDEFLVLLPDIRSSEVAMRVADRICGSLKDAVGLSGGPVELTASVGVACGTAGAVSADQLVKLADSAMYCSKQQGGGAPTLHGDVALAQMPRA